MTSRELHRRWIEELWMGQPIAAELVADELFGHWPDRDVRGPDELLAIVEQTRNMLSGLTFTTEVGPLVDGDLWPVGGAAPAEPPTVR
jgi:hypothetical protein